MVFPFTFSFSLPGILNPFRTSPSAPVLPHHENKTQIRTQQSPTNLRTEAENSSQATLYSYYSSGRPGLSLTQHSAVPVGPVALGSTIRRSSRSQLPKIPRRHTPSLSPTPSTVRALPLSRKRRWEPTFGEESIQSLQSATKSNSTTSLTFTSTSGYLDTPAKYRDMMETGSDAYREADEEDAPPLKKRRGLAGSIVSTAVSAALIGTAVGLTVYRFWRDRGKDGQIMDVPSSSGSSIDEDDKDSLPPPPYDAGAWKPAAQAPAISVPSSPRAKAAIASTSTPVATPRASVKSRRALQGSTRRPVGGSSRNRTRVVKHAHAAPSATRPEFDFGRAEVGMEDDSQTRTEVEDQMDWIGDKLSMLIEQGKRALQTEIVVMSEAKEDEVDDGRGEWEEEDAYDDDRQSVRSFQSRSRAGSVRKAKGSRPKNIMVPPSSSSSGVGLGLYNTQTSGTGSVTSLSASPRRSTYTAPTSTVSTSYASATGDFAPSTVPSPFYTPSGTGHVRGISYESAAGLSSTQSSPSVSTFSASVHDDPADWESPELRESMERARARLLTRRKGGV